MMSLTTNAKKQVASLVRTAAQGVAGQKSAFAEVITEVVNPNHISLEVLNLFMNTRSLAAGSQIVKRVRTGLPVYTMVPGTRHMASQIAQRSVMTYNIDFVISSVLFDWYELQRGEVATAADLMNEMQSAIIDEFVSRAFTLLASVWNPYTNSVTGSHYYDASATGLSEDILTSGMEKVLAHAGGIRAIVGTRAALLPIYQNIGIVDHTHSDGTTKTSIGIESILSEWKRVGRVSTYKGTRIVELPQIFKNTADGYYDKLMPDNKVLIVGDDAGEFILYGDAEVQEHKDTSIEPPVYKLSTWRGYGMMVDRPENLAVIEVPSPDYSW